MKILYINPYKATAEFIHVDKFSQDDLSQYLNSLEIEAVAYFKECDAYLFTSLNASKPNRSKGFIFNNKNYYSFGVVYSSSGINIPEKFANFFSFFTTDLEIIEE